MDQVRVTLRTGDPVIYEGLASFLRAAPSLDLVSAAEDARAAVIVVAAERLTTGVKAMLRRSAAERARPVVLVAGQIAEAEVLTAVECRVVAILPRPAVTAERLVRSVLAADAGGAVLPSNLAGELLRHIDRLTREGRAPAGPHAGGLTTREIDVLRLMASGMDTGEVAHQLSYSERTVKNVVHGVTHRLKLRNRLHAVAYAVRAGII